ncbi:hypothetical protein ACTNDY_10280 [Tissierellaceae bacterium HCP3S3_D8]
MKTLFIILMIIILSFTGCKKDTYPSNLNPTENEAPSTPIDEIGPENLEGTLVGMYIDVIDRLWETDPGLNGEDVKKIGFNLSELTNLTKEEKEQLIDIVAEKYEREPLVGTFDELSKEGYIAGVEGWSDGILITIKVTKVGKDNFTFDATKWRSGDGAYYFFNCKGILKDGSWSYRIGEEAIS